MPVKARTASSSGLHGKRRGTPRSKNGCTTCRIRHKKCGEETPQCLRCVENGYLCEYPVKVEKTKIQYKDITWAEVTVLAQHRPGGSAATITLPKSPRTTIFDNEAEFRYFTSVQNRGRGYSSGAVDEILWRKIALQTCYQEGFAKHALLALAAAQKALTADIWSSELPEERRKHTEFSLKHYAKALRLMREDDRMKTEINDELTLRNTVLSCIFVGTLEAYLGNVNFGAMLAIVVRGLRLVLDFYRRRMGRRITLGEIEPTAILDEDFISTLIYSHTFIIISSKNSLAIPRSSLDRDSDFVEITDRLKAMTDGKLVSRVSSTFVRRNYTAHPHHNAISAKHEVPPREAFPEPLGDIWADLLQIWTVIQPSMKLFSGDKAPLNGFGLHGNLDTLKEQDESEDDLPPNALKMPAEIQNQKTSNRQSSTRVDYQLLSLIDWEKTCWKQLEAYLEDPARSQDARIIMIKYLGVRLSKIPPDQQGEICDYVRRMLAIAKPLIITPTVPAPLIFTSGQNIGNELQLAITRCGDVALRKEAIDLLYKHPRGNGLWDNVMLAKVAEWSIQTATDLAAGKRLSPEGKVILEYVADSDALSRHNSWADK